jgi:hypothetical protein
MVALTTRHKDFLRRSKTLFTGRLFLRREMIGVESNSDGALLFASGAQRHTFICVPKRGKP